jgi:hypothetical protein
VERLVLALDVAILFTITVGLALFPSSVGGWGCGKPPWLRYWGIPTGKSADIARCASA